MPRSSLKSIGLVVLIVTVVGGPGGAAPSHDPPSASRTGGEPLGVFGGVELTRARLAELIRDFRNPDVSEIQNTEGEVHDDTEAAAPTSGAGPLLDTAAAPRRVLTTPPPVTSWKAIEGNGGIAADAQIAVSTTHVVVTNRVTLAFFDKAGTSLGMIDAKALYSPLGLDAASFKPYPIDTYFDLRAIFDPIRKRFWVFGLGVYANWRDGSLQPGDRRHIGAVAVSKTEDPADGWFLYWWDAVAHYGANDDVYTAGDVSDYPTLGIDTTLFHETHAVNNFDVNGDGTKKYRYWRVTFFAADSMAAGLPGGNIAAWQYWDLIHPDGSAATLIQAVVHHGASPRSFYASRFDNDQLIIWALAKALQQDQKISAVAVTILPAWLEPGDAPQPGGGRQIKMSNLGTKPLKAVFRDGFLHVATNDRALIFYSSVRYVRVMVSTYPTIFADSAHKFVSSRLGVDDAPERGGPAFAAWPAVEVNKNGDAAIVYTRSSSDIYPEVRFTTWLAGDKEPRLSRLLKAGEDTYDVSWWNGPLPWGDTAGASVDPKDDTAIWMAQQYASPAPGCCGSGNYSIWVGKVFGKQYFDLLFEEMTVASSPGTTGQMLVVTGRIHNGGDAPAPASGVTFSLDKGKRASVPLGTLPQDALRSGESVDFTATFVLSSPLDGGTYRVKATLKPLSDGEEYSRDNNVAEATFIAR